MRRSTYLKLFLVAAVATIIVASASVNSFNANAARATLPRVPICAFGLDPRYSPSAGETVTFTLSFATCKKLKLSVEYVVPAAVTKVVPKPIPTRRVDGNLVWVKQLYRKSFPSITLRMTFASSLQTGQKVKQKFIFRARGYAQFVQTVVQRINNR